MQNDGIDSTPELLSPAGNWDCARAAVAAGADAIYFGLPKFNARLRADNFIDADLPELMEFLHRHGVKGFVTMNTLIFTRELEAAEAQLRRIAAAGVDALIIQDLGLAKLARAVAPNVELHASTQMTITSPEGLAFIESLFPLERAVLARELSVREIERFHASNPQTENLHLKTPLEVFVHGALCVAYSGQCLTSESLGQRSANRGECAQACRMPYEIVVDGEVRDLGEVRYLLSPQDLAAVDLIPDLVKAGVKSFKIEGRLKSPEYVTAVTRVYRKALDAAIASIAGGIAGALAGIQIFPRIIFNSWAMMYTLPPMLETRQTLLVAFTVLLGFLVITFTAYYVTRTSLKEVPAMLLRPKVQYFGKTILLERIHGFWKRLSFSQKVTMRNIFRYKKRFIMTVTGIAGCAALLVAGFGLSSSIGKVVVRQYQEIFTYNLNMKYTAVSTTKEKEAVEEMLKSDAAVASYIKAAQLNATVKGEEDIAVTMISPLDPEAFTSFITLRHRTSQETFRLPSDGVVINEKLAKELGVSKGDTISVDNGDGAMKKVLVRDITENYVFHYIYIHPDYYKEIYRLAPENNAVFIKLQENTKEAEGILGKTLIDLPQVASVAYYRDASEKFEDSVVSLNAVVYAIILCAALLAFVVLYNLTNINLSERLREIATIKVLGFYNREVSLYVYRENMILTVLGGFIGLFLGVFLHRIIMTSIEQAGVMFGNYISLESFLFSFFITLLFGLLVNLFMYRKLVNIKMVESLKSVE